ncbi:MAG: hypothetical protein KDC98_02615 [Planctomycetes bacterium]|nr:hypothetical protein [Planctomycetota bacterium]
MILRSTPLLLVLLGGSLLAQSNSIQGTDVNLYSVDASTIYGRRGPAYPNGEVGVGFGHAYCNSGTVHVPWQTSPTTNGPMTDVHFKIAFLLARESNGRLVQISKPETMVKHSRVTYNLGSSQCGTCQSGPASTFRMGCFDAYTTGFNGDRFNLGPSEEIDPWLGSWDPVGSYFDRGDPPVGGAAATDGIQSLTQSQVAAFDQVKNRITVDESELATPGTFYGQAHLVCEGEPVANRGDNQRSNRFSFTWNGSSWSTSNLGGSVVGSILNQWSGATVNLGGNGTDDGRFAVAAKVTGPVGGMYHYEYAVHNIDNFRGGASFRIPLSAAIQVQNPGFRDINGNPLDDWTFSQSAAELAWTASANNPLNWNSFYNFYFDSDTAPGQGGVLIDEARIGTGALTVGVTATVPGGVTVAVSSPIGSSCGRCDTTFYEQFTTAAAFDLNNSSATLTLTNGNYHVGSGTGTYQTPTGTALALGDDAETLVNLPFSLPYPGGSTSSLVVCSNGFVSPTFGNGILWIPIYNLLIAQYPRWAVAWHDYAPQLGGQVLFDASPAGATLTWLNVANSGGLAGTSTFQVQYLPNGTVHMLWRNMSTQGNGYLIGWSPGQGAANPGNSDLTTALPAGIDLCASVPPQISLSTSARPLLGTTIQQITSPIATGTPFGALMMSLDQATPPVDLTPYGMEGCFAYPLGATTGGTVNHFFLPNGAGSVSIPFTIPNDMNLMGVTVVSQSFTYVQPLTTLGLIASNGVYMLLGPL